tara:strand:+ start:126091 stop:126660 length:570 start_codon:yes stop_codon:yes gene_type:complete
MQNGLEKLRHQVSVDTWMGIRLTGAEAQDILDHVDMLQSTVVALQAQVEANVNNPTAVKVAAVQEFTSGLVRCPEQHLSLADVLPAMKEYYHGLAKGLRAPEVYALYCSDVECPIRLAIYFDKDLAEQDRIAMERWQDQIPLSFKEDFVVSDELSDYLDTAPVGHHGTSCMTGTFSVVPIAIKTGKENV